MELTNEQRLFFGLESVDPSWDRMEVPSNTAHWGLSDDTVVVYFDGDVLRKVICIWKDGGFIESSYHLKTQNNRTVIAPITSKGKPKRLNGMNIMRCRPLGTYMDVHMNEDGTARVLIGNYDTQTTYYSSEMACVKLPPEEFISKWITETTEKDFADLNAFSSAKRKHCKFKEGDFFRFRFDRKHYGYGRVLFDVYKWVKSGGAFWNILMGRAVCVSIYHIVTEDPDVSIDELAKLDSCPSEYIMDNILYYGDCEIIGNASLPKEIDYPVMYGRSINFRDRDMDRICLCIGKTFREIPLAGNKLQARGFINNSMRYWPSINMNTVKACIEAKSNNPYWESKHTFSNLRDLRDPAFKEEYEAVKKQFGL